MSDFYTVSGTPSTGSAGQSSPIRAEFASIEAGFDKFPALSTNANEFLVINPTGTAVESKTAAEVRVAAGLVIGTDVQAYNANLTTWAGKTAPSGTVVGHNDAQTLTNKTIDFAGNTLTTTLAQLNTAISDDDVVASSTKDATGGYAGLTLFKINFKNAANTFTNFLTNATTAARTYTFPDKDGTVILDADKDISGGYAGLTLFKINFKNAANTFTSFLVNAATAARTYTFPDKDGTVALVEDKDISGGYAGLTSLKVNMYNAAGTFISFLTNSNTAARTYTFPDKDGTVAMTSDISAASASVVRVSVANGYGSTNTMIHRFTTINEDTGSDITYADSAANGGSFTINTTGNYAISSTHRATNGTAGNGISRNSSQLTTAIISISSGDRLAASSDGSGGPGIMSCSATLPLTAGDIIRSHGGGNTDHGTDATVFIITGPL